LERNLLGGTTLSHTTQSDHHRGAVQIGLTFFPLFWTSIGNIAYATALIYNLSSTEVILHPESPILSSNARAIQL
jgi:hypothetical protein